MYRCGRIGHEDKSYKFEIAVEGSQREHQFGPWMKAGNIMESPLRTKSNIQQNNKRKELVLTLKKGKENISPGEANRKKEKEIQDTNITYQSSPRVGKDRDQEGKEDQGKEPKKKEEQAI